MLEENGGGCGLSRALGHVSNSLALQRIGHQVVGQAAAGAWWSAGQGATNGDYQIKYLANQFVKAPFWYAQQMLASSHQPNVCGGFHVSFSDDHNRNVDFADWMAAVSDDGQTLVIRAENPTQYPIPINAALERTESRANTGHRGMDAAGKQDGRGKAATLGSLRREGAGWNRNVFVVTLSGSSLAGTNDFDTPDAIIPVNRTMTLAGTDGNMLSASLAPFSFTIFTLTK